MAHYIGVDVGTGSVRAAIVTDEGDIVATDVQEITTWTPAPDHYEQSSNDIWSAVCKTVRTALSRAGVDKSSVKGLGFDATCSLVALDGDFKPVTVSTSGKTECNVVLWMDHRAGQQALEVNNTGSSVLKYVGGKMSLEMQMPKLCWLKQNLLESCWNKAEHFFDLPDFLTWKATSSQTRSLCSVVCKWGFVAGEGQKSGWNSQFLTQIGQEDLTKNNFTKIGSEVLSPGEACGMGLTSQSAAELGLNPGTPVGTSVIDAHAGVLGCLGCVPEGPDISPLPPLSGRLVLICGTSTCHMAVNPSAVFVDGVWGPYYGVILPDHWLSEGGQSAAGKLIDFVIETHAAYQTALEEANKRGLHIHSYLNSHLEKLKVHQGIQLMAELSTDFHIWPDYHGNRSPVADPTLKGMVCGLTLAADVDSLALLYLATVQALAYGTRHIVSEMNEKGHHVSLLYLCGGLRNNDLFVTTTANVLNMPVVLPNTHESVLLGSAMLGAQASGNFSNIQDTMQRMGGRGRVVFPDHSVHGYHEKKYKVFLKMLDHQREYAAIMSS